MSTPKKRQGGKEIYDPAFKIAIAREYLTGSLGFVRLARKYNLRSESTARFFLRWYRSKYPDGIVEQPAGSIDEPGEDKALQDANLKITALEMLIEHASKEMGVDLVKKYGTKQPKK